MRKHFWLAIPLASMAFFAGCSCATGDCAAPVSDDCNTCVSSTQEYATVSGEVAYEGGYVAGDQAQYVHAGPIAAASQVVDAGVHVVEGAVHGVEGAFQSVGHVLGIASTQGVVQGVQGGEVMSAEQYMALIQSGKVTDPGYKAPGSAAPVEATEMMASIPSRFEYNTAPAVASVGVEVDAVAAPSVAVAPLPAPVAPMLSVASAAVAFGESTEEDFDAGMDDMSVASAEETPIRGDELSTPALMNAAALREANIVSATITADTGLVAPSGVQHIPSMPLPEGWDYVGEQDLGANTRGAVAEEASLDEQYFSDARSLVGAGSGSDI